MANASGPQRITIPTLQVIDLLLSEPDRTDWFALEVCRRTGLGSGSVTQILLRLQEWGWVANRWENTTEARQRGRPRRRFYQLTGLGASQARAVIRSRFPGLTRWAAT